MNSDKSIIWKRVELIISFYLLINWKFIFKVLITWILCRFSGYLLLLLVIETLVLILLGIQVINSPSITLFILFWTILIFLVFILLIFFFFFWILLISLLIFWRLLAIIFFYIWLYYLTCLLFCWLSFILFYLFLTI